MALPVLADVKNYLRIETAAEDATVQRMLTNATAMVETHLGAPLASGRTFRRSQSRVTGFVPVRSARSGNTEDTAAVANITVRPLNEHPDYATRIESVLFQAILDVTSELYHRRNPAIAGESAQGISRQYASESVVTPVGLPPRVVAMLRPIKAELAG